jgi:putative DNA primase/helicase
MGGGAAADHTAGNGAAGNGEFQHRLLVEKWLTDRGIAYRVKPEPDNKGRTVYVLKSCPFDPSHGDPDSCIMQEPSGKMSAHCFHNSCGGQGWQDFKEKIGKPDRSHYDPPYTKQPARGGGCKKKKEKPEYKNPSGAKEAEDDPHRLARLHLDDLNRLSPNDVGALVYWREEFLHWDGRRYRVKHSKEVTAELTACTKREFDRINIANQEESPEAETLPVSTGIINNAKQALTGMVLLPSTVDEPSWRSAHEWAATETLACRNGLLHLPSLVSGLDHFLPHTPQFFSRNALDFDFDITAAAPQAWLQFLADLWPDDPQSVEALQEWFGYCLLPDTRQQKILMLVGPKRSGKGTIARVLTGLVGRENVAGPTLSSLGTNFGLWPLLGKTVAIISDARLSGRSDSATITERLLSISGEDTLTVDRKNLEPVSVKLAARFAILTNELPRLGDASGALTGRMILLQLTQSWYGRENTVMTDRLLAELPGVLLWAVAGWQRLRGRGHFVQPAASAEMLGDLEDLSSPIAAFVRERCVVEPGCEVHVDDLYGSWKNWCDAIGKKEYGTRQVFGRDLKAAFPIIKIQQPRGEEGRSRRYLGIRLKTINE